MLMIVLFVSLLAAIIFGTGLSVQCCDDPPPPLSVT